MGSFETPKEAHYPVLGASKKASWRNWHLSPDVHIQAVKSGDGSERPPGQTGGEMGGGQAPDQEGSCEEGQRLSLMLRVTKGLRQGSSCVRKVTG